MCIIFWSINGYNGTVITRLVEILRTRSFKGIVATFGLCDIADHGEFRCLTTVPFGLRWEMTCRVGFGESGSLDVVVVTRRVCDVWGIIFELDVSISHQQAVEEFLLIRPI